MNLSEIEAETAWLEQLVNEKVNISDVPSFQFESNEKNINNINNVKVNENEIERNEPQSPLLNFDLRRRNYNINDNEIENKIHLLFENFGNDNNNNNINDNNDELLHGYPMKRNKKIKNKQNNNNNNNKHKILRSKNQVIREYENKWKEVHTFKPKINKLKKQENEEKDEELILKEKQERIARLYTSREKTIQKRRTLKNELDKQEMKECTFKPNLAKNTNKWIKKKQLSDKVNHLNNRNSKLSNLMPSFPEEYSYETLTLNDKLNKKESNYENVGERLYREAKKKELNHLYAKIHLEKEELDECTFQPEINKNEEKEESINRLPIYKRLGIMERKKRERMENLREEVEKESSYSFQPTINVKSKEIINRRNENNIDNNNSNNDSVIVLNVGQRLSQNAKSIKERRNQLAVRINDEEIKEKNITFKTEMSEGSKKIIEHNPTFNQSFHQRQKLYNVQKKMKIIKRIELEEKENDRNIITNKKKNDEILKVKRPDIFYETNENRIKRLAYDEQNKKKILERKYEREFQREHPFKPTIKILSNMQGKKSNHDELVNNYKGKKKMDLLKKKREDELKQKYTFQPRLITKKSKTSRKVVEEFQQRHPESKRDPLRLDDPESLGRNIQREKRERENRLNQKRIEKEIQEMEQCPFEPKINKKRIKNKGPVVIPGLEKHLMRKQRANKIKEEKQQIENNLRRGGVRNIKRTSDGRTITAPFQLTKPNTKRRKKLEEEVKKREQVECPFEPKTQAKQDRMLLRRLLEELDYSSDESDIEQYL